MVGDLANGFLIKVIELAIDGKSFAAARLILMRKREKNPMKGFNCAN